MENTNFKKIKNDVKKAIDFYQTCRLREWKNQLTNSNKNDYLENVPVYLSGMTAKEIVMFIKKTQSILSNEERRILKEDFIDYKFHWWIEFYSRATYYRIARITYLKFLKYLGAR